MVSARSQPHFDGEVVCEWIDEVGTGDRLMRLLQPLLFWDGSGALWIAPKGLLFDGASIPKAFWSVIGGPYEGQYRRAAVMHDAAYQQQLRSRSKCDAMLYEAMRADGCSEAKALTIFLAVRLFGWIAWRNDTKRKESHG